MASYEQLEAEPWWDREIVTDDLDWLGDQLCQLSGQPRSAFGTKGNNLHLNGGHRSQEWILNSVFCTNRGYTVRSGLSADQLRHIAAGDFTPGSWGTATNRVLMMQQTSNLWHAASERQLIGVTQVMGTLNGRTPIGLNVRTGTTFTPDFSHVDHWHLTFDRLYLRDRGLMTRIRDTALGEEMAIDQRDWDHVRWRIWDALVAGSDDATGPADLVGQDVWLPRFLKAMDAKLDALASRPLLTPEQVTALAAAVADELVGNVGVTEEQAQAAAERAVRRVLGSLREGTG